MRCPGQKVHNMFGGKMMFHKCQAGCYNHQSVGFILYKWQFSQIGYKKIVIIIVHEDMTAQHFRIHSVTKRRWHYKSKTVLPLDRFWQNKQCRIALVGKQASCNMPNCPSELLLERRKQGKQKARRPKMSSSPQARQLKRLKLWYLSWRSEGEGRGGEEKGKKKKNV